GFSSDNSVPLVIQPHLHVVEQQCPFFLPGDRYPAYPTQYAGEPTFLCIVYLHSGKVVFRQKLIKKTECNKHQMQSNVSLKIIGESFMLSSSTTPVHSTPSIDEN
ncbi:hypothetical protein L9F63_000617, partial [Diploptera punctata]